MDEETRYQTNTEFEDIVAGASGNKEDKAKDAVTFLGEFASFIAKLVEEFKKLLDEIGFSL